MTRFVSSQLGEFNMQGMIVAAVGGMIVIVLALLLSPTVVSNAVTAATTTGIGSFAGVSALLGLVPLLFVAGIIGVAVYVMVRQFQGGT